MLAREVPRLNFKESTYFSVGDSKKGNRVFPSNRRIVEREQAWRSGSGSSFDSRDPVILETGL